MAAQPIHRELRTGYQALLAAACAADSAESCRMLSPDPVRAKHAYIRYRARKPVVTLVACAVFLVACSQKQSSDGRPGPHLGVCSPNTTYPMPPSESQKVAAPRWVGPCWTAGVRGLRIFVGRFWFWISMPRGAYPLSQKHPPSERASTTFQQPRFASRGTQRGWTRRSRESDGFRGRVQYSISARLSRQASERSLSL